MTPFFRDEKKHRERWCGGGGEDFLLSLFSSTHHLFSSEISCIGQKKKRNLNSSLSFGQAALTIFLLVLVNDFVRPGLDAVIFMC